MSKIKKKTQGLFEYNCKILGKDRKQGLKKWKGISWFQVKKRYHKNVNLSKINGEIAIKISMIQFGNQRILFYQFIWNNKYQELVRTL